MPSRPQPPEGSYQLELTPSQKRLVKKVHENTGHPDKARMLRAFRAAGALPQVLRYIRDEFECEDCDLKHGPDNRCRAQFPRTFAVNKILSIDFLYVTFQGHQIPILNMVDVGASYQVAVRVEMPGGGRGGTPSSAATWKAFCQSWLRYFGAPQMLLCDSGNEFKSLFERQLELAGIYQHVTLPESPWQNGKAERHGGWLKDRLDSEIHGGRCTFNDLGELDEFLAALTSVKNRWLNRGGYTPTQLVFGQTPHIPGELLDENELGLHGLHDAHNDPMEVDEAAGEYRRSHALREKARQLALSQSSRDAIKRSSHAAQHQQRSWKPGQWVYVFRRAKASQDLHLRDRSVGPGIVVASNNSSVYVGMRTRLWRCSPEQLRAALPSEIMGRELMSDPGLAELLRQVVAGTQTGALDISKESGPTASEELGAVERDDLGVARGGEPLQIATRSHPLPDMVSSASDSAPQSAATPVAVVPDRLLPTPASSDAGLLPTPCVSRQVSQEEPAAEPQASGARVRLAPIPEADQEPAPKLPRLEEAQDLRVQEPPCKVPRTDAVPASASASESAAVSRVPGTPVGGLLRQTPLRMLLPGLLQLSLCHEMVGWHAL